VGFTVLLAVTGSALDGLAPYVDPVMVLITCVVFLPTTLAMIRSTTIELLEGSPPPRVAAALDAALAPVQAGFELRDIAIRASKVGPKLYLEVEAFADPGVTVAQVEALRQAIEAGTAHLPYDIWLNLDIRPARPRDGGMGAGEG
jgi:predicted Co/Zn/Cd cation transporter (cation efflux family)